MKTMNTIKKLAVAAAVAVFGLCGTGWAAPAAEADFTFDSATGTITGYTGAGGDVEIPAQINGVTVKIIGEDAFSGNAALTSVTIPAGVTNVWQAAFNGCSNLTNATFAAGSQLKSIGAYAFSDCTKLASVVFPTGVPLDIIDNYAFRSTALTSITIPASVTKIAARVFRQCASLTSVTFEEGSQLKSLGFSAFFYCPLTDIALPDTLTDIDDETFFGCSSLTNIIFGEESQLKTLGSEVFEECTALTSVTIPAGVTNIGMGAFAMCSKLEEVTVLATEPPTVGEMLFSADGSETPIATLKAIKVPAGSVDKYKETAGWGTYASLITAAAAPAAVEYYVWDEAEKALVAQTCTTYTVVTPDMETLGSGWYVVKDTVVIDRTGTDKAGLKVNGDAHLILCDDAELVVTGSMNYAGVEVDVVDSVTNSLSIYGQANQSGKLMATGGDGAGIGGGVDDVVGIVTIHGGTVIAMGDDDGAGIGSGKRKKRCDEFAGVVTINGGTVTAIGAEECAGIGGAGDCAGSMVTINGGVVTATGGENAAGIGGGGGGNGGSATINGGFVTATGGYGAAGIGGGQEGAGGTVTITGGEVTANGGYTAAGIGGGMMGAGGTVTITGGKVRAISFGEDEGESYVGGGGAGIGGGALGAGGTVTITGGDVIAISYPIDMEGNIYTGDGIGAGMNIEPSSPLSSGTLNLDGYAGVKIFVGMNTNDFTDVTEVQAEDFAVWHTNLYVKITTGAEPTPTTHAGTADDPWPYTGVDGKPGSMYTNENNEVIFVGGKPDTNEEEPWQTLDGLSPKPTKGYFPPNTTPEELAQYKAKGGFGETGNCVEYMDWDAATRTLVPRICTEYTAITNGKKRTEIISLSNGWYVVANTVTNVISAPSVVVSGDAHLILCDGVELDAYDNSSRALSSGVKVGINTDVVPAVTNSLTIYGQREGTGKLKAIGMGTAGNGSSGIGGASSRYGCGIITINGGTIDATGSEGGAGIGGASGADCGTITINGGTVTARGSQMSKHWKAGAGIGGGNDHAGGSVTINGGTITAIGINGAEGIGAGTGVTDTDTVFTFDYPGAYIYAGMSEDGDDATEVQADDYAMVWHTNCYVRIEPLSPEVEILSAESERPGGEWNESAQVVYSLKNLNAAKTYELAVEMLAAGQFAAKTSDISSVSGVYTQEVKRMEFFGIESQVEDREAQLTLKLIEK